MADVVSPVDSSKSPLRPLHSRSKSSHATAQIPTLNLASRLFRRTPSYHASPPPPTRNRSGSNNNNTAPPPPGQVHVSTITPAESQKIPESKIRPPRPSSLYVRSASHQIPSSSSTAAAAAPADPRITRISRPSADTRRVSFDVSQLEDMIAGAAAARGNDGMQAAAPQQQQQQNKRLSVGAIGRSASLRIKEGFGRRK
ncbi:MAG: hypothetical protein Q9193_002788 [Seirophora villosa]